MSCVSIAAAPSSPALPERILTAREAAEALSIGTRMLRRLRAEGCGPAFVQMSHRTFGYLPSDLSAWVQSRRCSGAGSAAQGPHHLT